MNPVTICLPCADRLSSYHDWATKVTLNGFSKSRVTRMLTPSFPLSTQCPFALIVLGLGSAWPWASGESVQNIACERTRRINAVDSRAETAEVHGLCERRQARVWGKRRQVGKCEGSV